MHFDRVSFAAVHVVYYCISCFTIIPEEVIKYLCFIDQC